MRPREAVFKSGQNKHNIVSHEIVTSFSGCDSMTLRFCYFWHANGIYGKYGYEFPSTPPLLLLLLSLSVSFAFFLLPTTVIKIPRSHR